MPNVTAPRVGVSIGTVVIGAQRYEVATHPEFVRFFESLVARVGGPTGSDVPLQGMEALMRANHAQQAQSGAPMPPDMGYIRSFVDHHAQPQMPPEMGYVRAFSAKPAFHQSAPDLEYIRAFMPHQSTPQPSTNFVELRALMPHAPANSPTADDAQIVLSSRIFGR